MAEIAELAIVRSSGGWRVVGGEGDGHIYAYQVDAEEAALGRAAKLRESGRTVTVLVQDSAGELRVLPT
jgi:hypothetical protein